MHLSGIADEADHLIETQINAHKELGWNLIELRSINKVGVADLPDAAYNTYVEYGRRAMKLVEEIRTSTAPADLKCEKRCCRSA